MIVKLQSNADNFEPALDQQGRGYRRVDPAGHRDDHPVAGGVARQIEVGQIGVGQIEVGDIAV
jgi:hypothetical protein